MPNVFIGDAEVVTALGFGLERNWNEMKNYEGVNRIPKRRAMPLTSEKSDFPVYPIDELHLDYYLTKEQLKYIDSIGFRNDWDFKMLAAVGSVLLKRNDIPMEKVGLVVAHENPGVATLIDHLLNTVQAEEHIEFSSFKDRFYNIQTFPHLFHLAKLLGTNGPSYVVNNACASGLYAIDLGSSLIERGHCDHVLVLSSDYAHFTEQKWLDDNGYNSKFENIRPFDNDRSGAVLGDGAGAMWLHKDIHKIEQNFTCEYVGSAFSQDNWRMTLPDITQHTYSKVIKEAKALLDQPIDLLTPHGVGSPLWDKYELKEIEKAFSGSKLPMLTAFKGYIGHTLGASALIETIYLIKCIQENTILPTANFTGNNASHLKIVKETENKKLSSGIKAVPAFGGFNAASVFKKVQ
ncbi:beta-ketoacyl synthase N-terminal-like domain-containing protein [Virgibacillus senegalensis]|uniref:beta-ketoacyl synthase N-terminal-like domain-containing protein n=1 Tax=Virgibacillus senegalensis TaxID=1499679 RepID=UPI00069F1D02|nr:beta-ketoacyl synthase N-terminal-like domain-containing protein [Virgibacillus senegalensis]